MLQPIYKLFLSNILHMFDIDFFLLPVLSAAQKLNIVEVTTLSITVNWTLPIGYFDGFIINCTSYSAYTSGALNVSGEIFSTRSVELNDIHNANIKSVQHIAFQCSFSIQATGRVTVQD